MHVFMIKKIVQTFQNYACIYDYFIIKFVFHI